MKLQTLILSLLLGLTHAATCPYSSHTATRGGSTANSATEESGDDSSSIVAELFKKAYQVKKGNVYAVPSRRPSRREIAVQRLQIHMLQHPDRFVTKRLAPILAQLLAAAAGAKTFEYGLPGLRAAFGQNFCASSAVVLSEWDQLVKDLTSPQARTFRLGTGILSSKKLPGMVHGGRNTFLLSLSQKGAGGDGMHEACQMAFMQFTVAKSASRQQDPVAKALISQLAEDYKTKPKRFFTNNREFGLFPFMIRYIHYCLFGINPLDKEKFDTLYNFFYANKADTASSYYIAGVGTVINVVEKGKFNALLPKVVKIYEESPHFASMPEKFSSMNLSKFEVAHLCMPIIAIAATVGPKHLLNFSMGNSKFKNFLKGNKMNEIDVLKIWDQIDLDDRAEVERYLYECGRIAMPVGHSHRVATEEFTVKMLGRNRTFPAGTPIVIPMYLAMFDENIWGKSTYEFDHNRDKLLENHMLFQSVGNKHAGRMCPGKFFAMNMCIEIITECGKVRREKAKAL